MLRFLMRLTVKLIIATGCCILKASWDADNHEGVLLRSLALWLLRSCYSKVDSKGGCRFSPLDSERCFCRDYGLMIEGHGTEKWLSLCECRACIVRLTKCKQRSCA